MASKNDKTSKTARVMNLLSKKPDPAASPDETAAPAAQTPIAAAIAPDAAVSVQIKNALEDALEGELAPQQAAPQPPEPQPKPAPASPEEPPVHIEDFVLADGPAAPKEFGAPDDGFVELEIPVELEHTFSEPENPGYINVMQVLVEEKAPKYVQMFGLCTCKRCMEDVKAITLNHLPPKYVVLEPGDRVPRLTVYEGKFTSDITAQLLQACKLVMERPHHSRQ